MNDQPTDERVMQALAGEHHLFAEHVAHSETWGETSALGRVVHEWSARPTPPDNHWFDCLVGCAAAASMCGVKSPGETSPERHRKRYTQADLRRRSRRTRTRPRRRLTGGGWSVAIASASISG